MYITSDFQLLGSVKRLGQEGDGGKKRKENFSVCLF